MPIQRRFVNGCTCGFISSVLPCPRLFVVGVKVARKQKSQKAKRSKSDTVFFNVRMPGLLRRDLEDAATANNHSMNTEIVRRLTQSFFELNRAKIIADALVGRLDRDVLNEVVNIVRRRNAAEESWREKLVERAAEEAGDEYAEHMVDLQREGGPEEENSK
jgi:hypothetical protein